VRPPSVAQEYGTRHATLPRHGMRQYAKRHTLGYRGASWAATPAPYGKLFLESALDAPIIDPSTGIPQFLAEAATYVMIHCFNSVLPASESSRFRAPNPYCYRSVQQHPLVR